MLNTINSGIFDYWRSYISNLSSIIYDVWALLYIDKPILFSERRGQHF